MKTAFAVNEERFALSGEAFDAGEHVPGRPVEVEVILAGDYKLRNLLVTEKVMKEMILNHERSGVDPAVDREHESWSPMAFEPSPAMGWVKSLAVGPSVKDPNRLALKATVEWTDIGANAVRSKHYRYISAGIDFGARDRQTGKPIGVMLDHVALVKHPFVQHMQPLSLSAAAPLPQEKPMKPVLLALGLKEDADEAAALSALEALTKKAADKDAEIAALKSSQATIQASLAKLQEDAKAEKLKNLESKLDAKISAFAIDPAEKAELMKLAAVDAAMFESLIALRQPRDPSGPKLVRASGADRKALRESAIADHMKLNGSSYVDAFTALATEKPELFTDEVA